MPYFITMAITKSSLSHWLSPTFCFIFISMFSSLVYLRCPPPLSPFPFLVECKTYSLRNQGYNDVNINVQTHKIEFDYYNVPQILILSIWTVLLRWRSYVLLLIRVTYVSFNTYLSLCSGETLIPN